MLINTNAYISLAMFGPNAKIDFWPSLVSDVVFVVYVTRHVQIPTKRFFAAAAWSVAAGALTMGAVAAIPQKSPVNETK